VFLFNAQLAGPCFYKALATTVTKAYRQITTNASMPPFITCFICLIFSFLNLVRWNSALKNFQNNIEGIENFLNASFHKISLIPQRKENTGPKEIALLIN